MPEESDFEKAMNVLMSGQRKQASVLLQQLYQQTLEKEEKIQIIDALLTTLNPIEDTQQLIMLSSEGIKLTNELGILDMQAHFMGRMAEFLMGKITLFQYQRTNLKLAPGWIGFSTEADKSKYEVLTETIKKLEEEVDQLLINASTVAESIGNKKVLAFILLSEASIEGLCYSQYKMECIQGSWRTKTWMLLRILRKWGYEVPVLFGFKHYKTLKMYVSSITLIYLKAARLLEEINDDGAGFAYFNLAVHLKTAYKFRQAQKYLHKAKIIAAKNGNGLLSTQINILEKLIKARNRDTPNYLEGETREEIVV